MLGGYKDGEGTQMTSKDILLQVEHLVKYFPITRGILEAHGGTIWVESPGHDEKSCPGSTFHILIPSRTESPDPKMTKLFDTLGKEK